MRLSALKKDNETQPDGYELGGLSIVLFIRYDKRSNNASTTTGSSFPPSRNMLVKFVIVSLRSRTLLACLLGPTPTHRWRASFACLLLLPRWKLLKYSYSGLCIPMRIDALIYRTFIYGIHGIIGILILVALYIFEYVNQC